MHRLSHNPARIPVGAQARGEVRQLRHRLGTEADTLAKAGSKLAPEVVAALAFKGSAGRRRALQRILASMPSRPTFIDNAGRYVCWRYFRPQATVLVGDEDKQDSALIVSALVIGLARGRPTRHEIPWGLVINSHALGRLLQRTDFKIDLVTTMVEAHNALLAAPAGVAQTMVDEVDWAVPAAGGAFLTSVRLLDHNGEAIALLTAETWIGDDWLKPNQRAQCAAIRYREPAGLTLGDTLLLPAILRPKTVITPGESGMVELIV
jgi:hypothetical protein